MKYKIIPAILLMILSWPLGAALPGKKPNILFILTDDQRWDTLGCYGNNAVKTPNLDRLAAAGSRLDAFYVAQPLCCPSRVNFLTGLYSHQTGILTNERQANPRAAKTAADYLNEAGYKTGFVGKSHVNIPKNWNFQEYPVYFNHSGSPHQNPKLVLDGKQQVVQGMITQIFVDQAIKFIESHQQESWFLWFATTAPHIPYLEDPKYKVRNMIPPPGWASKFSFNAKKWDGYYATINMMDEQIGRLLTRLDDLKLSENTVVIMASDNGNMMESHGIGGKNTWFEDSVRVPAILRWPGKIPAGTKSKGFFSSVDLLPTLLEIAGLPKPRNLEGSSIIPGIASEKPNRSEVFSESKEWMMVRNADWKYVITSDKKEKLYHLREDPHELSDVVHAKNNEPMLAQLREALNRWQQNTPALSDLPVKKQNQKKQKEQKKTEEEDQD